MKISLVTVCFNSEKTIEETFESVLRQTYRSIEYIVVDGMSRDGTLEIIRRYAARFAGLFDAMNKGIGMATGDVIGILTSDDRLAVPEAFEKIAATFERDRCDAVYSDLYVMDYETMQIPNRVFIAGKGSYKRGWYPPHPTLYLRREIYEKYGRYSLKYRVAADYDFMVRIMKQGIRMSYIPEVLVHMRAGGVSTQSLKAYKRSFDEAVDVLKANGVVLPYCVNVLRTVMLFMQRLRGMRVGRKKS